MYTPIEVLACLTATTYSINYDTKSIIIERFDRKVEINANYNTAKANVYEVYCSTLFENNKDYYITL